LSTFFNVEYCITDRVGFVLAGVDHRLTGGYLSLSRRRLVTERLYAICKGYK